LSGPETLVIAAAKATVVILGTGVGNHLSLSAVKATLASALAPRYGLLLMKPGMVLGDILFILDTDRNRSLKVLTFITPSSMPIHPSMFFIIGLTILSSVSVRSHLILRLRHQLMKSVMDSPFLGLVLAGSAIFILCDTMTNRALNESAISSQVWMLLFFND
jgi:hypothetical protein